MKNNKAYTKIKRILAVVPAMALLVAAVFGSGSLLPQSVERALVPAAAAACTTATLPTTYGVVTQTVNVATAGTYRVWSRIKAPDTTNNSYYFKVDSGCAYNVGDSTAIPANTWTWVNYQDGNTGAPIDVTLTAGSHTLTYTGKEANVQLDKVMLLGDTSCVPTTFGDNCAVTDTTSPTTSITSPSAGATVSGTVTINANASDASGVSRVDFLVDGAVKGSDTTASYSYAWDSKTVTNGSHTLQVKAYDTLGNVGTSTSVNVTVSNTVTPSGPGSVNNSSFTYSGTWAAATNSDSYQGDDQYNSTAGSTYSLTFTGTQAKIYTVKAPHHGIFAVKIDNGSEFMVDLYSATRSAQQLVYTSQVLSSGTHTITVRVTGTKNAASSGTTIVADRIDITNDTTASPQPTPPPPTPTCTKAGDANCDGRVNAIDNSLIISNDGRTDFPAGDFNKDGTIGAADMAILIANWTW